MPLPRVRTRRSRSWPTRTLMSTTLGFDELAAAKREQLAGQRGGALGRLADRGRGRRSAARRRRPRPGRTRVTVMMTVRRLLKSCAMPPARRPSRVRRSSCAAFISRSRSSVTSRRVRTTPCSRPLEKAVADTASSRRRGPVIVISSSSRSDASTSSIVSRPTADRTSPVRAGAQQVDELLGLRVDEAHPPLGVEQDDPGRQVADDLLEPLSLGRLDRADVLDQDRVLEREGRLVRDAGE